LAKSELIHVGSVDQVESLARILGCGVATLPVKYLGLPLGASYKSIHIRDGVIEKIERQLASWKMLYLSKGGRITPYQEYHCHYTHILFVSLPSPCEFCCSH
jgi:hypothetical protein